MDPAESRSALVALAELVRELRDVHKEFFDRARRRPDTIRRAKALEARVDRAVAEVLGELPGQGRLF